MPKDYFEDKKVKELAAFFRGIPLDPLKGCGFYPALTPVYETYARNVLRVVSLATYSTAVSVSALEYGRRVGRAIHIVTKKYEPKRLTRVQQEEIKLHLKMYDREYKDRSQRSLERRLSGYLSHVIEWSKENVFSSSKIIQGLDSLLPALVIFSWTSFETLSGDLLETAMNERRALAALSGRRRWGKPMVRRMPPWEGVTRKGVIRTESKPTKPGPGDDLEYDSIKKIRDNYWLAFSTDYHEIDAVLKHRSLDTLYALRNIMVHTGGEVDEIFLRRVAGLPFASVQRGNLLPLDFRMARLLVVSTVSRGLKLMAAVSRWIRDHPNA